MRTQHEGQRTRSPHETKIRTKETRNPREENEQTKRSSSVHYKPWKGQCLESEEPDKTA